MFCINAAGHKLNADSLFAWMDRNSNEYFSSQEVLMARQGASDQFVVTAAASLSSMGITGSSGISVSPPLVTLTNVATVVKRHKVTRIVLTFSGSFESVLASQKGLYSLVIAGKKGLFTAKNAMIIKVNKCSTAQPRARTR